MNEYRLLIVDSDADHVERTAEFLNMTAGLKVVGTACDGISAKKLLTSVEADVILMDPILPEMDGISLMKMVQTMKNRPLIICVSRFYTSISVELARRNGANYYVYKPIDSKSLAGIVLQCAAVMEQLLRAERQEDEEILRRSERMRRIRAIMRELGFSDKFSGSAYIAEVVAMAADSPTALHNLSTGIYARLAEMMHTTVACIERSIRTSIAAANANGTLSEVIGDSPTNKTCIRYILRLLNPQM